jgi:O-antigen ligase
MQLAENEPAVGPLHKVAFLCLVSYLFILHSRVLDLTFPFLHIPILTLYASMCAAFLGGGLLRAFTHRIGVCLLLLTAWMIMAVPFSVWIGGSIEATKMWLKTFVLYFVLAGLTTTWGQFRRAVHTLAWSVLVLALLALRYGDMSDGRLVLDVGRFTNPNDLAQILLMALPFWWYIAVNPNLKRSYRVLSYFAMVPIIMAMAKTGSRGAMIAAAVVAAILFWRSSVVNKMQLTIAFLVVVLSAGFLLPDYLVKRYLTFFGNDDTEPETELQERIEGSAVSSTWSRWDLLKDSVTLTLLHPVFGVGPGQFDVAQDLYSRETRGHKGSWQVTHNSFTEVSSQNGVPALIFYTAAIVFAFQAVKLPKVDPRQLTPRLAEIAAASFCMRLSLWAFVVSSMFGSFAFQSQFLTLGGLAVVFSRTGAPEFKRAIAGGATPPSSPQPLALPPIRRFSPVLARRAAGSMVPDA